MSDACGGCLVDCLGICCLCCAGTVINWMGLSPARSGRTGGRSINCCGRCCNESFNEDAFEKEVQRDLERTRDPNAVVTTQPTSNDNMNSRHNNHSVV
ncbi:hypothetical protein BDN72DRAFT_831966 [Pluteus cervinus]|uniref:Uncharacterized protein n=1 Tax=Pluteus cervinus TaxID=181527 RepID=A0ACD3BBW4_9AGAR|nr:hypothetical protein BDN72DRAFT_831966 [Pluteus cervinus]